MHAPLPLVGSSLSKDRERLSTARELRCPRDTAKSVLSRNSLLSNSIFVLSNHSINSIELLQFDSD